MNVYKQFISPQYRSVSLFAKPKIKTKGRSISYEPINHLNIFIIQGAIFQKDQLRRKSCHCNECGNISKFQYKYMNLNQEPCQRKKTVLIPRIDKKRQTKNSTFYKYKTIIFEQARKNRAEMQQMESVEATPRDTVDIRESMNRLKEYFEKQEAQKQQIPKKSRQFRTTTGNQTPISSPNHYYKSPRNKVIPYLSYRRIELTNLRPLKFSDTLKSFQVHKKTLSTQY